MMHLTWAVGILLVATATADRIRGAQKLVNANTNSETARDSVISKVIEMLESEKGKVAEDIKAEAAEMETYFDWCDDEQKDTGYEIKTATRKSEELLAKIADRTASIHALDEEIMELAEEITERNEEMDEANALRKKQNEDFKTNEAEQQAMVEELEHMQQELKRQMEAMTTPPPVPVEGEEGAEGADAEALLQLSHSGKANTTKSSKRHVSMSEVRAALEKMVDSVWVDPQSKKALGSVGSMLQQSSGSDDSEDPAAPAPAPDPLGQAQANGENNLAAFEISRAKQKSLCNACVMPRSRRNTIMTCACRH
jgi:DNA repair exonuclease SbcCD ATPase subunit